MYKSPIEIFTEEMRFCYDNNMMEAVQRYDIQVDKDELLKALRYDRQQYEMGFADGKISVYNNIVRCKNCDYRDGIEDTCGNIYCRLHDGRFDKDGYCSYGKRRTEDE